MDHAALTPLLIDAKREYVGQLTDVLAPFVVNYLAAVYVAAQRQDSRQVSLLFQKALRDIPHWNANTIHERTMEIQGKYTFLGDLIAACFVAYVKILSSVKLHQQKPNIRLKLPANDTFVHRVYVNVAREFYNSPSTIKADRATKLGIVRMAVEGAVRDMLPIEDILKAYLGNTIDDHAVNPAELADDEVPQPPAGWEPPPLQQQQLEENMMDPFAQQLQPQQQQPFPPAAEPTPPFGQAPMQFQGQLPPPQTQPPQFQAQPPPFPGQPPPQYTQPQAQTVPPFDPLLGTTNPDDVKQINISAGMAQQPQQQPLQQPQLQPYQQPADLFSDAEDEF